MATRREVAQRAGVSVATVSYVVNGTKAVTPAVRSRVQEAVNALGYRPNLVARGLATKKTRHVAILVDNLVNPHYCEILEGAQAVATENGYIVSVVSVDISNAEDIVSLASRGVDGAIVALAGRNELPLMQLSALPTVYPGLGVSINYAAAVDQMVSELKALGHRRIAFLSGIPLDDPEHVRYQGFVQALKRHGLPLCPQLLVDGTGQARTDERAGWVAAQTLLYRGQPFTALFAINDLMALGAMRALRQHGRRVPEDVSVVGCDRLRILQWLPTTLATLDTDSQKIGRALMRQLVDVLEGRAHQPAAIEARFVPGESIGPAPCQSAGGS